MKIKPTQKPTHWFYFAQAIIIHLLCYLVGILYFLLSWNQSQEIFRVYLLTSFGVAAAVSGLSLALAGRVEEREDKLRFTLAGEHCLHGAILGLILLPLSGLRGALARASSVAQNWFLLPINLLSLAIGFLALMFLAIGIAILAGQLAMRVSRHSR